MVFKKLFLKFLIIFELNEGEAASVSAVPEVVLKQSPAGPAHQVFENIKIKHIRSFKSIKIKQISSFENIKIKHTKSFEYRTNNPPEEVAKFYR